MKISLHTNVTEYRPASYLRYTEDRTAYLGKYDINPDNALEQTNNKFRNRFTYIENRSKEQGRTLKDMSLAEMDELWNEAKRDEQ
jgi:uncharacterized protein YabN with tetrapyrrole methylase and pyrophosphatase domain